MSKFMYGDKSYPGKVILLHDEEYLRKNLVVNDEFNVAFLDEESEELFLIDVKVKCMKQEYWGKFVTNIGIDVPWNDTENIIGKIRVKGKEINATIKPWMVERPITPESDPEYFV